jgi:hypothetical protein
MPVDPTFHLQPRQNAPKAKKLKSSKPLPWAPPARKPTIVPEGRPVGILDHATRAFLEGKTNAEVLRLLLEIYPTRKLSMVGIAGRRAELRRRLGEDAIAIDANVRRARGETPRFRKTEGVGVTAEKAIRAGATDEQALQKVLAKHPGASATVGSMSWYRAKLRKQDGAVQTNSEAKRSGVKRSRSR